MATETPSMNQVLSEGLVKPLEWREEVSDLWWSADAYRVEAFSGGVFSTRVADPQSRAFRTLCYGVDFDAAKTAAQSHYASRILSALVPSQPIPEKIEADMGAPPSATEEYTLRAMVYNYGDGPHSWDFLDKEVCQRAADEIKTLRAMLAAAPVLTTDDEAEVVAWRKPEHPSAVEPFFIDAEHRTKGWMMSVYTIPLYARALPTSEVATAGYLVWSNEHHAWWRANSQGYAKSILDAGTYTRDEALQIARTSRDGWRIDRRPDEIAVSLADIPDDIRAALRSQPVKPAGWTKPDIAGAIYG